MKTRTTAGITIFPAPSAQKWNPEEIWQLLAKVYNHMPLGITPCKNIRDAKLYTVVLLCGLAVTLPSLLLFACYLFHTMKKGGLK